jgi:type I restriction enzyme S subunit
VLYRADVVDRDFFRMAINFVLDELIAKAHGGAGLAHITKGRFEETEVLVPPLAEQRRIVARIEALFARIRQARADLLRIAPLADRYRQQSHRKLLDPGEHGWTTVTIDEIAHLLQYGSSAKTSDDASGVPVLRMGNILDGALDLTSLKFLPRDHHEFPSLLLQPGDILFNRTNSAELVGKTAVCEGRPAPCSFASYLIRLRVRGIDPTIVAAYINSPAGRVWAAASISQQVGQANINGAKLRALRVPRVPDHEQQEVADALRAATRIRTRLTAEATRALALLDHLERSILTRAFRGELVPQDPADEPASVSLARSQEGAPAAPRRGRPRRAA